MKKLILVCLLGTLVVMTGCVKLKKGGPAMIMMTGASFVGNTNITLTAGQSLTFDDPSDTGGPHRLSTGQDGSYDAEAGAPADLNNADGVDFALGTVKSYVFDTAGTYHITCQIHPSMNLTILVVPSQGGH
jgi:plastocyanin